MDITGTPVISDLVRMPHLLVAGGHGNRKECFSSIAMINSLLFKLPPDKAKLLMIDPKRIELSVYKDIPHLLHPVVTEPKVATRALKWAVQEMERRYMLLSDRGVRNIDAYNKKIVKQKAATAVGGDEGIGKTPSLYNTGYRRTCGPHDGFIKGCGGIYHTPCPDGKGRRHTSHYRNTETVC